MVRLWPVWLAIAGLAAGIFDYYSTRTMAMRVKTERKQRFIAKRAAIIASNNVDKEDWLSSLPALVLKDGVERNYLDDSEWPPEDAWGRAMLVTVSTEEIRLISFGPNGIDDRGTGDDIVFALNWELTGGP